MQCSSSFISIEISKRLRKHVESIGSIVYSSMFVIKQSELWSRSSDSDSISRAINQIISSYILLTARIRFCVINLRKDKHIEVKYKKVSLDTYVRILNTQNYIVAKWSYSVIDSHCGLGYTKFEFERKNNMKTSHQNLN